MSSSISSNDQPLYIAASPLLHKLAQMTYAKIAELNASKDHWAIQVRVCRMWEAIDFKNNNEVFALEMILVDDQGDSIQGYVRKNHVARFKTIIKESEVYALRNFKVTKASVQYRAVPNNQRIYFNVTTSVRAVTAAPGQIPHHVFYFPTQEILEDRVGNKSILTDIIGCVVAVGPTKTAATGLMKQVDLENNTHGLMRVTLWGNITSVFDLSPFEVEKAPIIVTVTSTTVRKFKGDFSYASTTITRLYFNLERPEVSALAERYAPGYTGIAILEDADAVKVPLDEQATLNRMTVAQLLATEWVSDNQTHFCTFVGEITEVDQRYGWCYVSCNNCSKKVVPKSGMFFCPTCNKPCSYPIIRYKLHVRAKDSTGSTMLVIFNDDAEKIIKAPTSNFTERVTTGEKDLPRAIGMLVGKKFVFKLKVTDYNLKDGFENYTVTKIFEEVATSPKQKVENALAPPHPVDSAAVGHPSCSGHNSLEPVTPEKKSLDAKKMKLGE